MLWNFLANVQSPPTGATEKGVEVRLKSLWPVGARRLVRCSSSSDRLLAYYTDWWDYDGIIPGGGRLSGEVRGGHAGEANYQIQQRHPEVNSVMGASYTVRRRRKNAAGRFVVWILQLVTLAGNRFDSGCDGSGNSSPDSRKVIVVEDFVSPDAHGSVNFDSLHGILNSSTNAEL